MGPLAAPDLTGYTEYRLTLHFVGAAGTAFAIQEMCSVRDRSIRSRSMSVVARSARRVS